jgi:NitT/TauT family transport system ATP-binding protein
MSALPEKTTNAPAGTAAMPATAAALLEVKGLGKRFAATTRGEAPWIVRDLTFSIAEGEFVTMLGPSGAGKSTILNMIAQVEAPTEGRILLRGRTVYGDGSRSLRPGLDRQVGYVTQDDNLLPWRTLEENVLFGLELQGRLDGEARRAAAELMQSVGLAGYERYYPHELSGGMRKRAALIRTLVYDPPIILMDEPFGALDAETRSQLQADLQALWALRRKTILFVTHDIAEAIALGDRVMVLKRAPAQVVAEHAVGLPRPRVVDDILTDPGFVGLHGAIRSQVR